MRTLFAIAALLALAAAPSATAEPTTPSWLPSPAAPAPAAAPYVEELPGVAGFHVVMIRFPSAPVGFPSSTQPSPDDICRILGYNAGPKYYGSDGHGNVSWIVCASR